MSRKEHVVENALGGEPSLGSLREGNGSPPSGGAAGVRWQEWLPALLAAGFILFCLPWVYRGGVGEPDSLGMVTQAYQGVLKGTYFAEPLYVRDGQPLYYGLVMGLTRVLGFDYQQMLLTFNHLALLATGLSIGLLAVLGRMVGSAWAGVIGATAAAGTLIVFEMATYTHPQTLSIALLLAGVLLAERAYHRWDERRRAAAGGLLLGLSFLLLVLGLLMRLDGVYLLPFLPAVLLARRPITWKLLLYAFSLPAAALVGALAGRWVWMQLFYPGGEQAKASSVADLFQMLLFFFQFPLSTGLQRFLYAAGAGTLVLVGAAGVSVVLRRDWKSLACMGLALLPALILALPSPYPTRRFIHTLFACGLAVALGLRASRFDKMPWAIAAVGLVFLGNWVLWPAVGVVVTKAMPDLKLPARLYRLTYPWILQHRDNQRWISEANPAFDGLLTKLGQSDRDLLGSWGDLNNFRAALARKNIPLVIEHKTIEDKKYSLAILTFQGRTHRFIELLPGKDLPLEIAPNPLVFQTYPEDFLRKLRNPELFQPSAHSYANMS